MNREEALEKIGQRIQLTEPLYRDVPAGTTGTVIHANLIHRFTDLDYGYADLYNLIVAWDLPSWPIMTIDETEYVGWFSKRA